MPILFAINNRKMIFPNMRNPSTCDCAPETCLIRDKIPMAIFSNFLHSGGINLIGPLELYFLEVTGRQSAEFLLYGQHRISAVFCKARSTRAFN